MSHITDLSAVHVRIRDLELREQLAAEAFCALKKQHAEACAVADRLATTATRLGSDLNAATVWLASPYEVMTPQSAEAHELLTRFRATLATCTFPTT